ncbi:transposase [Candidatus Enterovibrio escicola]
MLLRRQFIIERVPNQLKNLSQIKHSQHLGGALYGQADC